MRKKGLKATLRVTELFLRHAHSCRSPPRTRDRYHAVEEVRNEEDTQRSEWKELKAAAHDGRDGAFPSLALETQYMRFLEKSDEIFL